MKHSGKLSLNNPTKHNKQANPNTTIETTDRNGMN